MLRRVKGLDCWLSEMMHSDVQENTNGFWEGVRLYLAGNANYCLPYLSSIHGFMIPSIPLQFHHVIRKFCLFCKQDWFVTPSASLSITSLMALTFSVPLPFVAKHRSQLQTKCLYILTLIQVSDAEMSWDDIHQYLQDL